MTKYTPAPWEFMYRKQFEFWAVFMNHKMPDKYIATVFPDSVGDEKAEANARLIAAAPDLLEALKNLLDDRFDTTKAVANAFAAIIKATGEQP